MALALSTKAKIAAVTLTAISAMGVAFSASAQQTAATKPDFSRCDAMHQTNPKGAIACRVEAIEAHTRLMEQQSAAARQQSADARAEGSCADQLLALRDKDPTIVQRGKVILAGRPLKEFGACKLVSELTRG